MVYRRLFGAGLALGAFVPGSAFAQEPASEAPPQASPEPEVSQEATRLAAEGRWAEAAEKFRAALALEDTPATRFNLAQAELNVGKLATAQREFVRARDLARTQGAYDVQRLADDALRALAPRVPKLVIELPKDAREVEARIDGQRIGTESSILLDPGRHDLVVTARGHEPFVRALKLEEAQKLSIVVGFRQRPHEPRASRPVEQPRKPVAHAGGPPIGSWVLAGVGAAAFTSAALLHLRRNEKLDEAGQGCERSDGEFICPVSRKNDPEHRELIEDADRAELARDVLIGVGAGAWTAGALWWIFDRGRAERPVSVAVSPATTGASARLRVRF